MWAIGDAAAVPDPAHKDRPSPPTAQHVLRQGKVVGDNVAAALAGDGAARPFRYRTLGVFVDMGRKKAVASTLGIRWRGFPAWFLARTYHLAQMPSTARRGRLVVDWTVGLLFGRDSAELGQLGHRRARGRRPAARAERGRHGRGRRRRAGAGGAGALRPGGRHRSSRQRAATIGAIPLLSPRAGPAGPGR